MYQILLIAMLWQISYFQFPALSRILWPQFLTRTLLILHIHQLQNKSQNFYFHRMSEASKENKMKPKMKKDILHRIEKVEQNRMLRAREQNAADFEVEKHKAKDPNLLIDFEEEVEDVDNEDCFYIAEDQQIGGYEFVEQPKPHQELKVFCFQAEEDEELPYQEPPKQSQLEDIKIEGVNKNIQECNRAKQSQKQPSEKVQKITLPNPRAINNRNRIKKEEKKPIQFEEYSENESSDLSDSSEDEPLKGVTITSNPLEGNVTINIINKKQLLESPLPPGIVLKCLIRRSSAFINPEYDLYLHNGLKHLLSAKKYSLAKNEVFKLYSELGKYDDNYQIASIIANTVHSVYWVTTQPQNVNTCEIKGLVCYEKLAKGGHRKMKVFITHKQKIYADQKKLSYEGLAYLEGSETVVLENTFLGSKQNSIKNFTLVDEDDKEYEYLKLVKTSQNMFELMIQHPLSPIQACAIALTRFDAQLK